MSPNHHTDDCLGRCLISYYRALISETNNPKRPRDSLRKLLNSEMSPHDPSKRIRLRNCFGNLTKSVFAQTAMDMAGGVSKNECSICFICKVSES